jgi:hypothetical protein
VGGKVLRQASGTTRYSLAFFADPDSTVKLKQPQDPNSLKEEGVGGVTDSMTVAEYVRWRCGEATGIGVSFEGRSEESRIGIGLGDSP